VRAQCHDAASWRELDRVAEQVAERLREAVRWNVAKDIVVAWIVTMPAAGLLGAGFYLIANAAGMT
jgi:phosphate/sulfate permease